MKYKIAIFNTEFMDACVKTALAPFAEQCDFAFFYYKESGDIPGLYGRVEKDFDGFLVNGLIPTAVLSRTYPKRKKPVEAVHMDVLSYYKGLLKLSVSSPKVDLDRVCVDFMEDGSIRDRIVDGTIEALAEQYCTAVLNMPLGELLNQKQCLMDRVRRRREEGTLDMVVTRFSTVMEELEKERIPCCFIFPGRSYIEGVAGRLLTRLDMARMRNSLPAVIRISYGSEMTGCDELTELKLRHALLESARDSGGDFVVQKRDSCFEVFTSAGTLEQITDSASVCRLKPCLESALGEMVQMVRIGYGVGKNAVQAQQAACDACRESELHPAGASFMMDEEEHLIGPLSLGERLVLEARPSGEHRRMAEQTGISPLTLQKICAVSEGENDNIVTAQLLSDKLGLTVRATSKYLQKLVQGGAAQVAGTRQRKTRGRPELLIRILKPEEAGSLRGNDVNTEDMT